MKITKIALSMLISVILIFGCTACGNNNPAIDSSTPETNINSTSQLEYLTENVALFNSNSGAIYTYTLKEFTENINKRTEEQTFEYSKWAKQRLQTQEKTGVQFFSYTYDVLTDGTLVGKIEVCVEKESNYILGINIGVASNDTNAVKVALIYSLFGCEPKISNDMVVKITDRLGSNWNNQKYEMFCYNNSAFDLATENGMIIIQILPVSNDKIKEYNLPIIDTENEDNESEPTESSKPINLETTEQQETSEPTNSFQRTWKSSDGLYQMDIAEVYEDGSIVGNLKISNGSHSMIFDINVTPNNEGTYYQQINDGYETADFWFYFLDENQMQCSLNSENGGSIQFTMS